MVLDDAPCACGRTLVRARSIDGRSDDVLALPAAHGGTVAVQPLEFGVITRDAGVAEFQVVQQGTAVVVRLVPRPTAGDVEDRVATELRGRLAALGVAAPEVRVECVGELPRTAGGKLQLVVADRQTAGVKDSTRRADYAL
jgi:phenylacetate-CoA ligase